MKVTRLLLYILILSLPLGQFGRIPVGFEGVNFYIHDLIVPVLVFYWLIYSLAAKSLKIPKFYFYVLAFIAIAFISLINGKRWTSDFEFLVSAFYFLRWVLYSLVFLVVAGITKDKKTVEKYILISGLLLAIVGFVQLVILPDLSTLDRSLGWDPHKNRLVSSFFDPNFTGAYLVMGFTLALALRRFSFVTIFSIGILLTFSRSTWLMTSIVIATYGLLKSRKLLLVSLLVAASAYYFVPRVQTRISGATDPADSAHFRIISWKNTWDIAKDNLLTGVGFNSFRYAQKRYGFFTDFDNPSGGRAGAGSDSSILFVLATTGILGLVSYLLIYLKVLKDSLKDNILLTSLIPALLIESQFINSMFFPQIMILFWILVGLKYARN